MSFKQPHQGPAWMLSMKIDEERKKKIKDANNKNLILEK